MGFKVVILLPQPPLMLELQERATISTYKELISKIYKELLQLSNKNFKVDKDINKHVPQRKHTSGQQVYEKMIKSISRKIQIKTTMRIHFTSLRVAIFF